VTGRRLTRISLAGVLAALLAGTGVALAGGSRQEAHFTLTSHRPHHGTAERFVFDYRNPGDPMAQGSKACPKRSAIGGGVVTVDTGIPGPGRIVTADVRFFNNATDRDGEFIYLNTVRGSGARTVIRADVRRRKTITRAGRLPGAPPDGGAIDKVNLTVAAVHSRRGNYVTTPRRCPARGFWRTRVRFTYADDVTQTVPDRTRCEG
jgi:hypothetical protein